MLLKNRQNSDWLELHIDRFQFTEAEKLSHDDLQWLVMTVKVSASPDSWKSTDPCLTFNEAKWLIKWFKDVISGQIADREFEFIEPNLSFELLSKAEGEVTIRAYFELESRPPWKPSCGAEDDWHEVYIDLTVSNEDVLQAAESLLDDLKQLPPRRGLVMDVGE